MDNTSDSSIKFNRNGECNYCTEAINRMTSEYHPNNYGLQLLEKKFTQIKKEGKGKKYDCIIGISGGLDSSYVAYLATRYGLKMLAVHVDDGLDTHIAQNNINNLCRAANLNLEIIKPNKEQFADLTLSFLKASVPNIAMPQDNILVKALYQAAINHKIKYVLNGANFSSESILERSTKINSGDEKHIVAIHKIFGTIPITDLKLQSLFENYISRRYIYGLSIILPLNFIDYNVKKAVEDLKNFCNYEYYGGKHHESILTRFMQSYYLPHKFNFDKRKSHLSSLIISGQISRVEAIEALNDKKYNKEQKEQDMIFLANYFNISQHELETIINQPPKLHSDYPLSKMNSLAKTARLFRKYIG